MRNLKEQLDNYFSDYRLHPKSPQTSLRYCNECCSVWEGFYYQGYGGRSYTKYEDMPSYGLKREDCDECRERRQTTSEVE